MLVLLPLAAGAWLALLLFTPMLPVPVAGVIYLAGSLICHQFPERSFHAAGAQLPVCARCVGIYAGFFIGLCSWACGLACRDAWSLQRLRRILVAGAMPTILTVMAEWVGLWQPSNVTRASAGAVLGIALACMVVQAAAKLHYDACVPQRRIAPRPPATPI